MSTIRVDPMGVSDVPRSAAQASSWREANQAQLRAEFARLRRRLVATIRDDDTPEAAQALSPQALDPPSAIDQLGASFGLSKFERQILLLAAGIEMDATLAELCREASGRERRATGSITFSLALGALDDPHWSALSPTGPLRRHRLIELERGQGLTSAALRIDERVLHYLAGVNHLDARLEPLVQRRKHPHIIAEEHAALAREVLGSINLFAADAPVMHLSGDDPRGQEDVAAMLAHGAGRQLLILPVENLAHADASSLDPATAVSQFVTLWTREAVLLPAVLLVQCGANSLTATSRQLIERLSGPLILASRDPFRLDRRTRRYNVHKPTRASQKLLWFEALDTRTTNPSGSGQESTVLLEPVIDALTAQFRLSADAIAMVGASVSASLDLLTNSRAKVAEQLWSACRSLSSSRLEELAERITPAATWEDLILPEVQHATLRQLCAQARHRLTVHESWGFATRRQRDLGISALFVGASGTGKTLAAEVLACELGLDLFRIELSALASKYSGSFEKILKEVFDAAEEGGALLLFEEADALFGKRSDVKDSHDRYANIEVNFLLRRMESFQGIVVLTTDPRSSLNKAFQPHLRFRVDFPLPGPAEREAIWRRVFPDAAPVRDLDIGRLAQLEMTGGSIRNIALTAAFLAAEAGSSIEMRHVLQATRQEAMRVQRPLAESEIRGWA
ncbi:MAG: ATP-binding protein [Rhodanobacter sp.]